MHELSLVEDILRIAGKESGGRTVTRVVLEVGALTCVTPEALEFCFDSCKAAAALAQAQLTIERRAGVARCDQCGNEFEIGELYQPCACGSFDKDILQGQELRIISLELQ